MNRVLLFIFGLIFLANVSAAKASYKPPVIDRKAFAQNAPFNIQNFERIHDGMFYDEVKRLLGRDGIKGVDQMYLGAHCEVYVWFRNPDFIEVGFSDGRVNTYSAYVDRTLVEVR